MRHTGCSRRAVPAGESSSNSDVSDTSGRSPATRSPASSHPKAGPDRPAGYALRGRVVASAHRLLLDETQRDCQAYRRHLGWLASSAGLARSCLAIEHDRGSGGQRSSVSTYSDSSRSPDGGRESTLFCGSERVCGLMLYFRDAIPTGNSRLDRAPRGLGQRMEPIDRTHRRDVQRRVHVGARGGRMDHPRARWHLEG